MSLLDWIAENWAPLLAALGLAATVASTVLVRWIDFYGADHPRALRLARFILSLLSLLPARGAQGRGIRLLAGTKEVQLPGVSWSAPKPLRQRLRRALGLSAIVLACLAVAGCGSATRQALDGAYRVGVQAHREVRGDAFCRPVLHDCMARKQSPCPALDRCQAVQPKLLEGVRELQRLVLAGWRAHALGQAANAQEALSGALTLVQQLAEQLADWGLKLEVPR